MDGSQVGVGRPLYFLHIAKTGGTSVADAIGRLYRPDQTLGHVGELSVAELERMGDRLADLAFIAGHAGPGVARYLEGRADIITMLRRPEDQAVSNYLHVLAYKQNALHDAAASRSFSDFLRENPWQIYYQAGAIGVALAEPIDPARPETGRPVLDFLAALPFVGVIEQADLCCDILSEMIGADRPVEIPCLNSAAYRGVSASTLAGLRREYHDLRSDPRLGDLFALEERAYQRATQVLERLRRALPEKTSSRRRALEPGFIGAWRFQNRRGPLEGLEHICSLVDSPTHLVYGPFARLKPGRYAVEFHIDVPTPRVRGGRIEIEVAANRATSLSRRQLRIGSKWPPGRRTLIFRNSDEANVLEFRIRARGCRGGRLVFKGVTVRPFEIAAAWPLVGRRRSKGA